MAKKRKIVVFDERLKQYKEYTFSSAQIVSALGVFVFFVVFASFTLGSFVFSRSNAIKVNRLNEANALLWKSIEELKERLVVYEEKLASLMEKDEQLRLALNIPSVPSEVREVGFGGTELVKGIQDYEHLFEKDQIREFKDILYRTEKLGLELEFEKKSYEELLVSFKNQEDSIRYIPCINPVPNHAYVSSRFGRRLHPILKVIRMHEGLDLASNYGSPIYAPADGVVVYVGKNGSYGNFIIIDHLKGFETRYGHLSRINVEIGQKVRRGEKIGEVGSSGLSTNPHLHYEVVYKGKNLDPELFIIE